MSTPSPPAKTPINKKQLLDDLFTFFSIIGTVVFLNLTYKFKIFEQFSAFKLDNYGEIIIIFVLYAVLVTLLKGLAFVIKLIRKTQGEDNLSAYIQQAVSSSLFIVLVTVTVYILSTISGSEFGFNVQKLCYVTLWLFLAQLNRIFGTVIGKLVSFDGLSVVSKTIESVLIVGGLTALIGVDFFLFL